MNYELFEHSHKKIYLTDMKSKKAYFSELVSQAIKKQISLKKKILLLTNKIWYASGIICTSCGNIPQCTFCSVSISYNKSSNGLLYWLCSICKTIYDSISHCETCGKETLKQYGLTTQKVAEWIEQEFGKEALVIQAKHWSSFPKAKRLLDAIKQHQIIVSTDAIISPEIDKQFDLIIVLAADQGLSLPDYNAQEQVFYRLHRIFNHFDSPFYIIQSYDTEHPSIRLACHNQKTEFLEYLAKFYKEYNYPPVGELCIIKFNNENETTLHNAINKLQQELTYLQQLYKYTDIEIFSSSPLIYKKFWKFYYHIILKGKEVRPFLDIAFSKLNMAKRGYKIDRMAESLL